MKLYKNSHGKNKQKMFPFFLIFHKFLSVFSTCFTCLTPSKRVQKRHATARLGTLVANAMAVHKDDGKCMEA